MRVSPCDVEGMVVRDPETCSCEYGPTRWGRGAETADTCFDCGKLIPKHRIDDSVTGQSFKDQMRSITDIDV